jgi:hypothetical protein
MIVCKASTTTVKQNKTPITPANKRMPPHYSRQRRMQNRNILTSPTAIKEID